MFVSKERIDPCCWSMTACMYNGPCLSVSLLYLTQRINWPGMFCIFFQHSLCAHCTTFNDCDLLYLSSYRAQIFVQYAYSIQAVYYSWLSLQIIVLNECIRRIWWTVLFVRLNLFYFDLKTIKKGSKVQWRHLVTYRNCPWIQPISSGPMASLPAALHSNAQTHASPSPNKTETDISLGHVMFWAHDNGSKCDQIPLTWSCCFRKFKPSLKAFFTTYKTSIYTVRGKSSNIRVDILDDKKMRKFHLKSKCSIKIPSQ